MSLLEVERLSVFYEDFQALFEVTLAVQPGEVVAVIGANGAGKTTLLKSITGLVAPRQGAIRFDGHDIFAASPHEIARLGIAMTPEGRRLFASLSVRENLLMGANVGRAGPWSEPEVYRLFPQIEPLSAARAGNLSGGEQQMVAIGRALMANPSILLLDELSMGLAPKIVAEVYRALEAMRGLGIAIVLVEQEVSRALATADRCYCLLEGAVTLSGRTDELARNAITSAYFGE